MQYYVGLLFVLLLCSCEGRIRRVKKLECDCDPAICKNLVCSMVLDRRNFVHFKLGMTPIEPAEKLWIRIAVMAKTSKKIAQPKPLVDTTQDICKVMANEGTALNFMRSFTSAFSERDRKQFEGLIHSCPFGEQWLVQFEQKPGNSPMTAFLPAGEYRTEARVYNDRNQTFIRIVLLFVMLE